MELSVFSEKILQFIRKYKFVILVFCIGIALMLLPHQTEPDAQLPIDEAVENTHSSENALKYILSKISGAGRVEVLLTESVAEETDYQIDEDSSDAQGNNSNRTSTVIVTDASRNERGLVKRIRAPVYRGAIIVCDGADDPTVRLSIVDAVSKVTGLSTNHISVLKME